MIVIETASPKQIVDAYFDVCVHTSDAGSTLSKDPCNTLVLYRNRFRSIRDLYMTDNERLNRLFNDITIIYHDEKIDVNSRELMLLYVLGEYEWTNHKRVYCLLNAVRTDITMFLHDHIGKIDVYEETLGHVYDADMIQLDQFFECYDDVHKLDIKDVNAVLADDMFTELPWPMPKRKLGNCYVIGSRLYTYDNSVGAYVRVFDVCDV